MASFGFLAKVCCVERIMSNLDLVNWTMQKARQLSPEHHIPSKIEGSHLLDKLLEVLGGERIKRTDLPANPQETIPRSAPSVQLTDDSPVTAQPYEVADRTEASTASDLPVSTPAAPLAPADVPAVPMSALLKAIVGPDIYTALADRERAITLRWVLRDIKANRLKLSPVDQHDLRDLIDMGLVEMRNDAPVLTNAGVDAII
jgi:hypothetical protein